MTDQTIHDALTESEQKFFKVFRGSPLVLTLTSAIDHRYLDVNENFERITGWSRDEVIGRTPFDIGLWINPRQRVDFVKQLLSGGTVRNVEVNAYMKNGEIRKGLGSAALIEINGETCILGITADITNLHRPREASASPVMIWMSGLNGPYSYFNQPWFDFTGRPLEKQVGHGWEESIHPDDLIRYSNIYKQAFNRRESYQVRFRLRRHDGEYRCILASAMPRFNTDNSFAGYIGAALDVTEPRVAEVALSKAVRSLIREQEKERTTVAQKLHEYIERLALLCIEMDRLEDTSSEPLLESGYEAGTAKQQIEDFALDIQNLSEGLRPSKLVILGLEAAASSFCKEISLQKEVEISFACEGVPDQLSQEISFCLFRVLQEALQNATGDARSPRLEVLLNGGSNGLYLTVRSLKIIFAPADALKTTGLGLTIMEERLKLVAGNLSVESHPGRGTTIQAHVPSINFTWNG